MTDEQQDDAEFTWSQAALAAGDADEPTARRRPPFFRAIALGVLIYFAAGMAISFLPIGDLAGFAVLIAFAAGIWWVGRRYRLASPGEWVIVGVGSFVTALVLSYLLLGLMLYLVQQNR